MQTENFTLLISSGDDQEQTKLSGILCLKKNFIYLYLVIYYGDDQEKKLSVQLSKDELLSSTMFQGVLESLFEKYCRVICFLLVLCKINYCWLRSKKKMNKELHALNGNTTLQSNEEKKLNREKSVRPVPKVDIIVPNWPQVSPSSAPVRVVPLQADEKKSSPALVPHRPRPPKKYCGQWKFPRKINVDPEGNFYDLEEVLSSYCYDKYNYYKALVNDKIIRGIFKKNRCYQAFKTKRIYVDYISFVAINQYAKTMNWTRRTLKEEDLKSYKSNTSNSESP